jgi:hypothetical protein
MWQREADLPQAYEVVNANTVLGVCKNGMSSSIDTWHSILDWALAVVGCLTIGRQEFALRTSNSPGRTLLISCGSRQHNNQCSSADG